MPAPLSLDRLRQSTERRLKRYRIDMLGARWAVIGSISIGDMVERAFVTRDEAEDYLFRKLAEIQPTRGDLIRET